MDKTICHFKSSADARVLSRLMFELALKDSGLEAGQVIHVGDSVTSDIKGASDVGIRGILVNRDNRPIPEGVISVRNLLEIIEIKNGDILMERSENSEKIV